MVNCDAVGSFVFFITCLVAGFHEISNRFSKFLWDGSGCVHNRKSKSAATLDLVVSAHKAVITDTDCNETSSVARTIISRVFHHFGGRVQTELEDTENVLWPAVSGYGLVKALASLLGLVVLQTPLFERRRLSEQRLVLALRAGDNDLAICRRFHWG